MWNSQSLWTVGGENILCAKLEILNVYHLGCPVHFKVRGRSHGRWSGWSETKQCLTVSSTSSVCVSMWMWVQILLSVNLCAQFLSMHVALELCKQPTQICNIAHPTLSPSLVVILALLYCCSRQHIYVIHQSPCNIWTFKLISMVLALAASVCWPTLKIEVTFMSGTVVSLVWARNIDYD